MPIKFNLNILVIIFLIILFLLIMFKDNLKSTFTKQYVLNKQRFGNLYSSDGTPFTNTDNYGGVTLSYILPALTGLYSSGSVTAKWCKWPLIYVFDPTANGAVGQIAATDSYYISTGYFVTNINNNATLKAAVIPSIAPTPTNTGASATAASYSSPNFPTNLFNILGYYTAAKVGTVTATENNIITNWSGTTTGTPTTQLIPDSSGNILSTAPINMSITLSGGVNAFYNPMVGGRNYIIGLSNLTNIPRQGVTSSFPNLGKYSNFVYKDMVCNLTEGALSATVTFGTVSTTSVSV